MSEEKKPPRSRNRSRTEVESEFSNLNQQPVLSQKERTLKEAHDALMRGSVNNLSAEKVTQELAKAGVSVQKTLSALNEEVLTRLQQLDSIKQNIALEVEELTRLYGVDTVQAHLDVLIAQHDEKKQALEDESAAQRALWVEEKKNTLKLEAEFKSELAKERQREKDAYDYKTAQDQKTAQDAFNEEMRIKKAGERDRQEELNKSWAAREEALKLREKELADLKAAVENFPKQLEAEANKRVGAATGAMKKDHEHEISLLKVGAQSDKALLEAQIKSLNDALEREKTLSTALRTELAMANQKNAEIATKALDSTSSRELATTLQAALKDQSNGGSARKS